MSTPINPPELAPPRGYSNGLRFEAGRTLFIAGQIGWNREGELAEGFLAQFDLAMANMMAVVANAGGTAEHLGRMTIYLT
ncbi:MAG: Rid family hydrolase, partial [Myxococcota bacterium]